MVTKGYGFTVHDIDWSCPADLEPYAKAHNKEIKERDTLNWLLGQYFASALDATVCNSELWRKKGSEPHEYIRKPIMQEIEQKHSGYKESNEDIAVYEMKLRAKALERQGLPESPM